MLLIFVASVTASLSYSFLSRLLFTTDYANEFASWYAKSKGRTVNKDDVDESSAYMGKSTVVLGVLALMSWLILAALLAAR